MARTTRSIVPYKKKRRKWTKKRKSTVLTKFREPIKKGGLEMKSVNRVIENSNLLILGQQYQNVLHPCQVGSGAEENERVGNNIVLRGIHVRGHLFNKPGNPAIMYRWLILEDMKYNNSSTVGDELFIKQGSMVDYDQGTESAYLSPNKQRYKIYHDQTIKVAGENYNGDNVVIFKKFLKFQLPIKFSGLGLSSIQTHNIQIFGFPINPSGQVLTTEKLMVNLQCTAYYEDP